MKNNNNYNFLLADLTKLEGVGKKTMEILKKKKINNIFDLLWRLPKSYTDRSLISKINELQIGQIHTIKIIPKKYSFPRIRNLPNKVNCEDITGKIDCIFFNSYEGYVKKILPLNEEELIYLSDLMDMDDENLYKFNQGIKTTIKIEKNTVSDLFRNFVFKKE